MKSYELHWMQEPMSLAVGFDLAFGASNAALSAG
jgi:hypothetical protein